MYLKKLVNGFIVLNDTLFPRGFFFPPNEKAKLFYEM